ncbi:hypothetical protein Slin15195_G046170 [Septoria linicola]|uniref:Uncharacterized protein n=1 Tax=Septoria linicola TaxID=215465 RepID=A0A9Q9ASF8_9PEZI|nr:hypothetical protein Slin14017_G049700 [Septoria linicola]USW51298.1 hypothetical protein Slin15195_G046170 [Septoria linicola]
MSGLPSHNGDYQDDDDSALDNDGCISPHYDYPPSPGYDSDGDSSPEYGSYGGNTPGYSPGDHHLCEASQPFDKSWEAGNQILVTHHQLKADDGMAVRANALGTEFGETTIVL